jgi:hypothetical protein
MTWEQNWEICCSLGMQPLQIKSQEEQTCFNKLTSGTKIYIFSNCLLYTECTKGNWSYNFNYWTSGLQKEGCPGNWSWCGSNGKHEQISGDLSWQTGQPDNKTGKENCLHLRIFSNQTGGKFSDRNCSHNYIYACEVSTSI